MIDTILNVVSHYGYAAIMGSMVLGIIGLPIPDEMLMTFAGYLISQGRLSYLPTVIVSVMGSVIGMSVSYAVGWRWGYRLLEKIGGKVGITRAKLDRAQDWFRKVGKFAVTIGYFIPGLRHLTAYSAGISKWSYGSFLLYAVPGASLWAVTFITLGTYLGAHWRTVTEMIHRYLLLVLVALVVAGLAYWLFRRAFLAKKGAK